MAFESGGVRVLAAPTEHRPVHPTVGYRFEHDGAVVVCCRRHASPARASTGCSPGPTSTSRRVCRRSAVEAIPSPRLQDILDYHSDLPQAGQTAARGGVGTLVLTHMVPPPAPGTEDEWVAEVAEHFAGTIVLAEDLTVVEALAVGVTSVTRGDDRTGRLEGYAKPRSPSRWSCWA